MLILIIDFCTNDDPFLAKVLVDSGMNNFSNQFKITRLVCVMCFQKMHNPEKDGGEPFYRVDVNSNISLTSRWSNAMENTKRTNLRTSKLDHILKKVEQAAIRKNLDVKEFNVKRLTEKYFELLEMKGKPATDWVVKLGEECFILYYCVGCDTAPIAANMWLRCARKPQLLNIRCNSGPNGHWRCGICLEKYRPKVANQFCFFVVGDANDHFVGFLGNVSSSIDNEIAYLKTLTLVRQITTSSGDVPITNEIIVQALRELNKEAGDFLGSFPKVKNYRTKNPN